jgi:hypothetical protein
LRSYCTRTVSPSVHPRPASVGAADFFLASALFHQQALRPLGAEDARCVRSISATQSNYVYPHLVCSRLRSPLSQRGRPTESWAPYGRTGGLDVSRRPRPLWRIAGGAVPHAEHLAASVMSVGVFFPRHRLRSSPLTSLSRSPVHPRASLAFARAACRRAVGFWPRNTGRRMR